MVLGYHLILSVYGFWLPNDPRGSWSDFVWSWELFRYGKATTADSCRSLAGVDHDHELRRQAKTALKFPPVCFTGRQALAVARGFDQARQEGGYTFLACSILPEHMHLVVERHDRPIGRIVGHLKARATQRLKWENLWGWSDRSVWAAGYWKVFLRMPDDLHRAVEYVRSNPEKEGKPRQVWSFVMERDEQEPTPGKPGG